MVGGVEATEGISGLVYTITIINKSTAKIDASIKMNFKKSTQSETFIKDSLFLKEYDVKYKLDSYVT